ncbi:MAG: glycosyltransferase family 2 protein [Cetobacterium sp.]
MKVSVLVAVYNSEFFLKRCLDSLLNQTLDEVQIICIDDGSTDKSIEILEKYQSNNKNIEVYSQRNNGASSARNLGLNYSVGEYICMVDSDDYISEDCLKITYELIKNKKLDAGIFELILTDGKTNKLVKDEYKNKILSGKEACILSLDWKISGLGLYKADILKFIKYDESNINGDELSTRKFLYQSKKVGFSLGKYYYYQNNESVTRKISIKRFDQLKNKIEIYKFLMNAKIYNSAKIIFNESGYSEVLSTIKLLKSLEKNYFSLEEEKIIKILQQDVLKIIDFKLLRGVYFRKGKIKKLLYTYLSLNTLYKIV